MEPRIFQELITVVEFFDSWLFAAEILVLIPLSAVLLKLRRTPVQQPFAEIDDSQTKSQEIKRPVLRACPMCSGLLTGKNHHCRDCRRAFLPAASHSVFPLMRPGFRGPDEPQPDQEAE